MTGIYLTEYTVLLEAMRTPASQLHTARQQLEGQVVAAGREDGPAGCAQLAQPHETARAAQSSRYLHDARVSMVTIRPRARLGTKARATGTPLRSVGRVGRQMRMRRTREWGPAFLHGGVTSECLSPLHRTPVAAVISLANVIVHISVAHVSLFLCLP